VDVSTGSSEGMGSQEATSPSFLRYFNKDHFYQIEKVFNILLGGVANPIEGPPELNRVAICWGDTLVYQKFPRLDPSPACQVHVKRSAWSLASRGPSNIDHVISVCPVHSLRITTSLIAFDCNRLLGSNLAVDPKFLTQGTVILA
jgi:hypothetical protein